LASLCPLPLDCSETYGRLTIDTWSLHTGAWCAFDLSTLTDSPEFRGENILVERLAGRVARPMLTDETTYTLPMLFSGAEDRTGTPWTSPAGGLLANIRALSDRIVEPLRDTDATLPATLEVPDPDDPDADLTYVFDVQPLRIVKELLPGGYARGVLTLRVPVPDPLLDAPAVPSP